MKYRILITFFLSILFFDSLGQSGRSVFLPQGIYPGSMRDDGTGDWKNAVSSPDTTVFHSGRQSLRISRLQNHTTDWQAVLYMGSMSREFRGKEVNISFWYKSRGKVSATIRSPSGETKVITSSEVDIKQNKTAAWNKMSFLMFVSPNSNSFGWSVEVQGASEKTGREEEKESPAFWMDDILVEESTNTRPVSRSASEYFFAKYYPTILTLDDPGFELPFSRYAYHDGYFDLGRLGIEQYWERPAGVDEDSYTTDVIGIIKTSPTKEIVLSGKKQVSAWHQTILKNGSKTGRAEIVQTGHAATSTVTSVEFDHGFRNTTFTLAQCRNVLDGEFFLIKYQTDRTQRICFLIIEYLGNDEQKAKDLFSNNRKAITAAELDKIITEKNKYLIAFEKQQNEKERKVDGDGSFPSISSLKPRIVPQQDHDADIVVMTNSPGGKYLATGDSKGSIRIWDLRSSRILQVLKTHTGPVTALCFSSDDQFLFSGGADNRLVKWSISTQLPIKIAEKRKVVVSQNSPIEAGTIVSSGSVGHQSPPSVIRYIKDKIYSLSATDFFQWDTHLNYYTEVLLRYDKSTPVTFNIEEGTGHLLSLDAASQELITWKPSAGTPQKPQNYRLAFDEGKVVTEDKKLTFNPLSASGYTSFRFHNETIDKATKQIKTHLGDNFKWMAAPGKYDLIFSDRLLQVFERDAENSSWEETMPLKKSRIQEIKYTEDGEQIVILTHSLSGSSLYWYDLHKGKLIKTHNIDKQYFTTASLRDNEIFLAGHTGPRKMALLNRLDLRNGIVVPLKKSLLEDIIGVELSKTALTLITPGGNVKANLTENIWIKEHDNKQRPNEYTGRSFNGVWTVAGSGKNSLFLAKNGQRPTYIKLKYPGDSSEVAFAVPSNDGMHIFCATKTPKPKSNVNTVMIFDSLGNWVNRGYTTVWLDHGNINKPLLNRPLYWPDKDNNPTSVDKSLPSRLYSPISKSREPLQDTLNLSAGYGMVTLLGERPEQGNFLYFLSRQSNPPNHWEVTHNTDQQRRFWAYAAGPYIAAGEYPWGAQLLSRATNFNEQEATWAPRGYTAGQIGHQSAINQVQFSPDNSLLCTSDEDGTWIIWSLQDYTITKNRLLWQVPSAHEGGVRLLRFLDNQTLVTVGQDNLVKFWNLRDWKEIMTVAVFKNTKDHFIYTPEGYYYTTKGSSGHFTYTLDGKSLPLEEFDLQFNRPDKVYPAWKSIFTDEASASEIDCKTQWFQCLHSKRLETLYGIKPGTDDRLESPLPDLDIKSTSEKKGILELTLKARSHAPLSALKITVNGNPVSAPENLIVSRKTSLNTTVEVPLSHGNNEIKAWVTDTNSVSSLKETITVYYAGGKSTPDLYVLVAGVNHFEDKKLTNLRFAEKDAEDFAQMFMNHKNKFYNSVNVTRLIGKDFNLENLRKATETFKNAHIDDQIMVLVSSHGQNGFIATHSTPADAFEKGISISALESLISSSPARRKLLALDACYTGEGDTKARVAGKADGKGPGVTGVSNSKIGSAPGTQCGCDRIPDSFEPVKDFYYDLREKSGTTVIASSSAASASFELPKLANGVFTYSLKQAISEIYKEKGKNGRVSLFELIEYLPEVVERNAQTIGENQKSTIRTFNYSNNFPVW